MRLGLESPSPRMAPSPPRRRSPVARSSAFSPIDVDGDSTDDAEPSAARRASQDLATLSSPYSRPTLLDLSPDDNNTGTRHRNLHHESSDESEKKQNEPESRSNSFDQTQETQEKKRLNFFFNMDQYTSPRPRRESSSFSRRSNSNPSSARSSPVKDELHEVISAARTSICGQKFDRCELEFGQKRVELTIWKDGNPRWQGKIEYAHMMRFCFSRVDQPPYILLLQLDNSRGRSDFATFFDPIFAQVCEKNDAKEQRPKVYGVVFFFDDVVAYTRCQSMGDNNPSLAHLFREKLSEGEVREYLKLDASNRLRQPRRVELKGSSSSSAGGRSLSSVMGNTAKKALSSVTAFFRPTPRSSVLEAGDNLSVVRDRGSSNRVRTLDLSRESNGISHADFGEEKTPISIDDAGTDKLGRGSGADSGAETVVLMQNTQHEESESKAASADVLEAKREEKQNEKVEKVGSKKRAASSWLGDEKVKQRRIESRRNEVLLTYPYDGSDTSGRISVTLGDVDRLVPGEFLNDNIIDFYLRFLWRHLDSWQQQQMYFFTSHFFTQLNGTNGAHELTNADPDERFARVARWTQKETNLFDKRFLFIPINDSFHWSVAVFCNPGSAIIKKHRKVRRRRRVVTDLDKREIVDLVDGDGDGGEGEVKSEGVGKDVDVEEEVEEEELPSCQEDRLANPPCLLFLDSLRCHRKKKFTKMLRNYLECEWKARYASSAVVTEPKQKSVSGTDETNEEESIVTVFDLKSIGLLEPNIPLQSNSSDCGVFLLMYAASIVRLFPAGVTREDLENNLTSMLTPNMFHDEHVREFREYLQQLLFCLQFLEKHGLAEQKVKEEGLETFTIDY